MDRLMAWSAILAVIEHMKERAADDGDDHSVGLCNCAQKADIAVLEKVRDLLSSHRDTDG